MQVGLEFKSAIHLYRLYLLFFCTIRELSDIHEFVPHPKQLCYAREMKGVCACSSVSFF